MWSERDEVTVREWCSSLSASLEGIVIASPPSRAGRAYKSQWSSRNGWYQFSSKCVIQWD